ncbi:MAG: PTS galactitol transporter subunit IIBC [Elusimicrobiota bacterium]|nr:PTS galactitol transporter subunit IIBC [Elusimicrobiota bacterium]
MRVIIAAHGDLASQLLKSVEDLLGPVDGVMALNFMRRQSTRELVDELDKLLRMHADEDVFVLTDFLGGSPCNCACRFMQTSNVRIISGVNLPMLIEIMIKKEKMPPDELCAHVIKAAKDSIADVRVKFSTDCETGLSSPKEDS